MNPDTVKQFQEAVGSFCWRTNYVDFCRKLNREPDSWTAAKWGELQNLHQSLTAFDPNTLAKLLTPNPDPENCQTGTDPASGKSWTAEEILRREG